MRHIILVLLLFFSFHVHAQSTTWEKQFHFDYTNLARAAIETEDSGFFVPAYIADSTFGAYWLVKLNKYGNFVWRKIIDSTGGDVSSLIYNGNGNYYLVDIGSKYDSVKKMGSDNDKIIEFDKNGDILFEKTYNSLVDNYLPGTVYPLANGSYLLMGVLYSNHDPNRYINNSSCKLIFQKFNRNNSIVWSDTFGFANITGGSTILKTHDNKLIIGGAIIQNNTSTKSYAYLLELDSTGKQLAYFPYPYTIDSSEFVFNIIQLNDGNLMVQTSNWDEAPVYFTLADSNGNTFKRWTINKFPHGIGGFVPDGDSFYVYTDLSFLSGPLSLLKYDTALNQTWSKLYDDTAGYYNGAGRILRTYDGGMLLVATRSQQDTSTGIGVGISDIVIIKVDKNGNCANENFAGLNHSFLSNQISVYPNPARDNIYINTQNISTVLSMDIFDSRGTKVIALPQLCPATGKIDVSNLSKGLYMYRLYDDFGVYFEGKFIKE